MCSLSRGWIAATLTMLVPCALGAQARLFVVDSAWLPTRIDRPPSPYVAGDQGPNVLRFRNGRHLTVDLYEVRVLGQLPRSGHAPFLVLGARMCYSCDAIDAVYVVPADADRVRGPLKGYHHPGSFRAYDSDDTTAIYRGRTFLGHCLVDTPQPLAVWFQAWRDSLPQWRREVFRLFVRGDSIQGEFLKMQPALSQTLETVRSGACAEIPGLDNPED